MQNIKYKLNTKYKKVLIFFFFSGVLALGLGFFASLAMKSYQIPFLEAKPKLTFAQEVALDLKDKCQAAGEQCYSNEFAKLAKAESLATSLAVLNEVNKIDPGTRGCHLIAHSISIESTLKDPDNWQDVLSKIPADKCTGGFLHGIFEARQSDDPSIRIDEKTIPEFCKIVKTKAKGGTEWDCAHIFGHLLVVVNEVDLTKANSVCAKLPENLQYECYSGVYMENETREGIINHGLGTHIPWNENTTQDQQKLCEDATGIEANACWREISHMFSYIAKGYPPKLYSYCQEAGVEKWIDDCFLHGVGVMVVTTGFDPKNFPILCSPYEEDNNKYAMCLSWGIGSMLTSSPEFVNMAITLCESVPFRFKEGCFQRVSDRLARVVPAEKLAEYCKDMPYPYQKRCEYPYL